MSIAELVPILGLVVLLVVAFQHLPDAVEGAIAVAASVLCVVTAASTWGDAGDAVRRILPVVVFLVAILVVAGACADLGVFRAIGERIGRPGLSPSRFLALTFVAAVGVTAVLSLDATVVLLTLVVLAAAGTAGVAARPGLFACVRLANSSSLLLPVSNLTTLLAVHRLDLSFGRFALVMAPAWVVVIGVEYAAHRLFFSSDLVPTAPATEPAPAPGHLPRFPVVVLVVMLVGFGVVPLLGLDQAWAAAVVAVAAAVVLLPATSARRTVLASGHPGFGVFVLGLAVVVDALTRGGLADAVHDVLPTSDGLPALLGLALIATVLANVVNNLPATLLLVPLVAPLGTLPMLAALVGLNVGASLTWTGSLANLLWRRTLTGAGWHPSSRDFHRVSLVTVPVAVALGVVVTWAWAGIAL
ncbi:MAG: arsenic transporter [Nocardioidaceae bacterium]|nr:arsenic transporter [Nocardioidaceae bacterium]